MLDLDAGKSPDPFDAVTPENDANHHPATPIADDDLLTVERHLSQSTQDLLSTGPVADGNEKVTYYIQIITATDTAILQTNLPHTDVVKPTEHGIAWILGRSRSCTIVFPDPAVSRCHAVLSYHPDKGLQLMDAGSSNGTSVNGKRLVAMSTQSLTDGDIIKISHISVKIFIT